MTDLPTRRQTAARWPVARASFYRSSPDLLPSACRKMSIQGNGGGLHGAAFVVVRPTPLKNCVCCHARRRQTASAKIAGKKQDLPVPLRQHVPQDPLCWCLGVHLLCGHHRSPCCRIMIPTLRAVTNQLLSMAAALHTQLQLLPTAHVCTVKHIPSPQCCIGHTLPHI